MGFYSNFNKVPYNDESLTMGSSHKMPKNGPFLRWSPISNTVSSIFPSFSIRSPFLGDFSRFYAKFEKVRFSNGTFMNDRKKGCDQNWSNFRVGPQFRTIFRLGLAQFNLTTFIYNTFRVFVLNMKNSHS